MRYETSWYQFSRRAQHAIPPFNQRWKIQFCFDVQESVELPSWEDASLSDWYTDAVALQSYTFVANLEYRSVYNLVWLREQMWRTGSYVKAYVCGSEEIYCLFFFYFFLLSSEIHRLSASFGIFRVNNWGKWKYHRTAYKNLRRHINRLIFFK